MYLSRMQRDSSANRDVNLLWGTYTWILFHWMGEQIKEEYFQEEREKLLTFIVKICSLLPCPTCREHARDYLKHTSINLVRTKDELRHYLFHFHNSVNLRSKKEYQPHSILDKYKQINFDLLFKSWDYHFSFGNDIQRNDFMAKRNLSTLKQRLKTYFSENHHKFLMI
jgi:hypothetical protein